MEYVKMVIAITYFYLVELPWFLSISLALFYCYFAETIDLAGVLAIIFKISIVNAKTLKLFQWLTSYMQSIA